MSSSAGGLSPAQYHQSQQAGPSIPGAAAPGLALRHTNVSNPSFIEHKPSLQSVTASEDYYSLSGGSGESTYSAEVAAGRGSANTIHRFRTPPSRYRTPLQSRDYLPVASGEAVGAAGDAAEEPEFRKTPMRGQGRRRQSSEESRGPGVGVATTAVAAAPVLREGGIRRKPVPSTVMEQTGREDDWPRSEEEIDPMNARSSVARDLDRERSPPTPGVDDTPFIRFALDQLTRDEEVRGSRNYRGLGSGVDGNYPYLLPEAQATPAVPMAVATGNMKETRGPLREQERRRTPPFTQTRDHEPSSLNAGAAALPLVAGLAAKDMQPSRTPPPRNPARVSDIPIGAAAAQPYGTLQPCRDPADDRFLPLASDHNQGTHQRLNFLPGILRPMRLIFYLLAILAYLICLLFCAIYSLIHTGLADYGSFGDGRYFVFEYLPTLLGVVLFFWTVQVEVAVYRIAPFIGMASQSPRSRRAGAELPLVPRGFMLPYFGHFGAGLGAVGFFVVVAWLQIWSIPLLASSFNVYYQGSPAAGQWRWIATQGAIWVTIAIYLLLLIAATMLLAWLKLGRRTTGLRWDPKSLADMIVLLERSNALDHHNDEHHDTEPPQLGYWRTNARPNEVMHTYGFADKAARRYSLDNGRILEKSPLPQHVSNPRMSAEPLDLESGAGANDQRHSREKMLPRQSEDGEASSHHANGTALPWFLRPSLAALWIIIAIVLLLAFLIVSYLPSTRVGSGFAPDVPAPVNTMGFSATNFLYSFLSALLGMLCLLFWLDIDYAYRRLQTFAVLATDEGEVAERSLLLAYPAELPGIVTATAAVNGHWRVAIISFVSLIAATLPILAGGVFWAQFYISAQKTRISAQMPGFYALTFFCVVYALAYFLVFPSRSLRRACSTLGREGIKTMSFRDVLALVRGSRILDDVAFHSASSRTDLVTRLLSAAPGTAGLVRHQEGMASKVSVADSVRGFGRARQQAGVQGLETAGGGVPRYLLGRHFGRDGREFVGVDRVR
ncbi:hypothetical protein LTR86_007547 [Recurvomyces mirabilis]|nr:hypothetical protein LTR86_007547 [Recurvomyces mirabilis]